jgi:hypothetical protein
MEYDFHKSKIPKGLSYPVKRSFLDKILEDSGIDRIKWVSFNLGNQKTNIIVWANFIGEAHKTGSAGNVGLYVYAVPSNERNQIEKLLIEQGFPKFIEWLKKIEIFGEAWRSKTRLFEIEFKDGELSFSETV